MYIDILKIARMRKKAINCFSSNDYHGALKYLDEALYNYEEPHLHALRMAALMSLERYDEALNEIEIILNNSALQNINLLIEVYVAKGLCYYKKQDMPSAKKWFTCTIYIWNMRQMVWDTILPVPESCDEDAMRRHYEIACTYLKKYI